MSASGHSTVPTSRPSSTAPEKPAGGSVANRRGYCDSAARTRGSTDTRDAACAAPSPRRPGFCAAAGGFASGDEHERGWAEGCVGGIGMKRRLGEHQQEVLRGGREI
eukprot:353893-Chlamydomonas_euryale.AAC.17